MQRLPWRWIIGGLLVVVIGGTLLTVQSPSATKPDKFADNRPGGEVAIPFDGKRALADLKTICDLGPRISGSQEMAKQQALIIKHFKECGATVTLQDFKAGAKSKGDEVPMTNIIASFQPDLPKRVIICAHYDTRPIADQENDPRLRNKTFLGANDGGAGAAFLMELARNFKSVKTSVGVDLVLFDGEEYIFERGDLYFHGSKHFAQTWKDNGSRPKYHGAVLVDMIAGRDPKFPVEQNSWWYAANLVKEIYGIANEQKCDFFRGDKYSATPVEDDHMPLNQVGIPAIDIIDFSYPHWHRITDTPENCSKEGMEQVAKVLGVWIQRVR